MPADTRLPTVPLAHEIHGSGRGPAVLLIAGTGYSGSTWPTEFVGPLARRYAVVTFDHRGTGRTPGTPEAYSTRLFAADVAALLDELGIDAAHVLGHSMGGRVAQWLALDAPERVRSLVLAASGPGQFESGHRQTQGIPVATALGLVEHGYEVYMRDLITRNFFTAAFAEAHPERVKSLVRAFWKNRPGLEDYLKHVTARQEHRTADRLHEIGLPTLVLIGEADTHVGGTGSHWDQSQYLAANIPGADLGVIEDAKHGFFWSHPERTVELLTAWIDRIEGSTS